MSTSYSKVFCTTVYKEVKEMLHQGFQDNCWLRKPVCNHVKYLIYRKSRFTLFIVIRDENARIC